MNTKSVQLTEDEIKSLIRYNKLRISEMSNEFTKLDISQLSEYIDRMKYLDK